MKLEAIYVEMFAIVSDLSTYPEFRVERSPLAAAHLPTTAITTFDIMSDRPSKPNLN